MSNLLPASAQDVEEYITKKILDLSKDWDYDDPITPTSKLFGELGMESLDVVVLAIAIQEHFRQPMPFAELFADIGQSQRDLTIEELTKFVSDQVAGQQAQAAREHA